MIAGLAHESRNALQQSQACLELLALKVERWPDIANLVRTCKRPRITCITCTRRYAVTPPRSSSTMNEPIWADC